MAREEVVTVWTGEKVRRIVASRDHASANHRAKDAAMRSIGMVKVRGNLGGTHWE